MLYNTAGVPEIANLVSKPLTGFKALLKVCKLAESGNSEINR
jgi:hypothetical protein